MAPSGVDTYPDLVDVSLPVGTSAAARTQIFSNVAADVVDTWDKYGFVTLRVRNGETVQSAISKPLQNPTVKTAHPVYQSIAPYVDPNDPCYSQANTNNCGWATYYPTEQWDKKRMYVAQANDLTRGASYVTVGIIGGAVWDHPEFAGRLTHYNTCVAPQGGSTPYQYEDHATWTAGVALATAFNSAGDAGIDSNARIVSLDLSSPNGSCSAGDPIVNGLKYAASNHIPVVIVDRANANYIELYTAVSEYIASANGVVVNAASNCGEPLTTDTTSPCPTGFAATNLDCPACYTIFPAMPGTTYQSLPVIALSANLA